MKFADCIGGDKTLFMPSTEKYARYFASGSGNLHAYYTFDDKGGRYVKAKINLHELAPNYFNKDGSHTMEYSISAVMIISSNTKKQTTAVIMTPPCTSRAAVL